MGTLNSISLELIAQESSSQTTYTDTSGVTTNVTVSVGAKITVTAPSSITLTGTPSQSGFDAGLQPLQSFQVMGGSASITDNQLITLPAMFAPYESPGGGTFNPTASAVLAVNVVGGTGTTAPSGAFGVYASKSSSDIRLHANPRASRMASCDHRIGWSIVRGAAVTPKETSRTRIGMTRPMTNAEIHQPTFDFEAIKRSAWAQLT